MATEVATLPLHSKRVQAWVYAVMNPLIESLRREISLLEKGNLSWRFYSKKCEYIRLIREYVESSQWPNYEDFIADSQNQGFRASLEEHDRLLSRVESGAVEFFQRLMSSSLFQKEVAESLQAYEASLRADPLYTDLKPMKEDLPRYVAEYVINRTDLLPDHYLMHKFWANYRRDFESLWKEEFERYHERQSFVALKQAAEALCNVSEQLLDRLEAHRQLLCTKYDIPFAPFPVNQSDRADRFVF